jgi:hypothetical protein
LFYRIARLKVTIELFFATSAALRLCVNASKMLCSEPFTARKRPFSKRNQSPISITSRSAPYKAELFSSGRFCIRLNGKDRTTPDELVNLKAELWNSFEFFATLKRSVMAYIRHVPAFNSSITAVNVLK